MLSGALGSTLLALISIIINNTTISIGGKMNRRRLTNVKFTTGSETVLSVAA